MANIPSQTWDESSPAGSQSILLGDNRIREMKTQIREVIGVDHDFPSSGQAADNGQHLRVTLQEQADLGTGAVGTTILGSQTIATKGELVYTDEDDNDIQLTNGGQMNWLTIGAKLMPVGFVVTLGVSTNPNTLFGFGTWTAIEGKVIVGISNEAGDEAFDTLNETGGAQTVTLTAAQSGVPAHTHGIHNSAGGGGGGGDLTNLQKTDNTNLGGINTDANATANASEAHTNLQPYIVKYVWERTA